MLGFIVISFCIASISYTICVTSIFKWFRELVSDIHPKIEELVHCPYCLGHYIAIVILIMTDFRINCIDDAIFVNFIVTWFSIMGAVGCIHYVMNRSYEPIAKAMVSRKLEKLNKEK